MDWLKHIPVEPIQFVYGTVAIAGGVARYLNSFANGVGQFKVSIFFASAFVAGFSGWMFAIMGVTLNMPQGIVFMMAGSGGFFGEQTMKFIMEYLGNRTKEVV